MSLQRWICQSHYGLMLVGLIFSTGKTHLGLMLSILSIVLAQYYSLISKKWIFCYKFDFQTLSEEDLPNGALADATIKELEDEDGKTQNEYRMDILWYHFQSMKSPIGNNKRFNILFEVARIVLLIPHSYAAIEGLFSLVNKNHQIEIALTKIRPYLLF